jgi:preprotein translocase subunit YajC
MISTAWAQDAAMLPANDMNSVLMSALPFLLVFAVFYFFVMRPQMTAAKKHNDLVSGLKRGDVILTDGGVIGEIVTVKDHLAHVRVADGVVMTIAKEGVRSTLVGDAAKGWEAKGSDVAKKR